MQKIEQGEVVSHFNLRKSARVSGAGLLLAAVALLRMTPAAAQAPSELARATEADHQQMMQQLGITQLRKGPNGDATAPDHANYEESVANPYPNYPDPLRMNDGTKVTTAAQWNSKRRPQIIEDRQDEPAAAPKK